jgi:hypothetical protein
MVDMKMSIGGIWVRISGINHFRIIKTNITTEKHGETRKNVEH